MKLPQLLCITFFFFGCFVACNNRGSIVITNQSLDSVYSHYDKAMWQYNRVGNFDESLAVVDSIYKNQKISNTLHSIIYFRINSWVNRSMARYDVSKRYADSAITLFKQVGINTETAKHFSIVMLDKGFDEMKLGNYEQGYKCLFEAKKAIDLINNICGDTWPLDSYGLILFQQQEYDLARGAFVEQLNIIKNCNKKIDVEYLFQQQNLLDNIGLCFTKQHKLDSAKHYYLKALEAIEKMPSINVKDTVAAKARYFSAKGVVLGNLAKVFINTNSDSAILLYQQSIAYNLKNAVEIKDAQLSMFQLANVFLSKKQNNEAIQLLNNLKLSLDTIENAEALLGYKKSLVQYYKNVNQYQPALESIEKYNWLKDSLHQKEAGINTTNVNKELRDREQQLQIQLLQKNKRIDNLYLSLVVGVLLLVMLLAFFIYRNYIKSKKQNTVLVGLNNEITQQQKETEYALQELEVSNKEKDRILGVVAHDLRNPIGAIVSLAHFVNESDENNANTEVIKMIESSGNHSLSLINELLETNKSAKEKLNLADTDIVELVKQTVFLLQHKAEEKKQRLIINIPEEKIILKIDANKIERVLNNLITNAIKFSHKNKSVYIVVSQSIDNVTISIKDQGVGISQNILPHIFEKNVNVGTQGTSGEKSYGLGLSICKQIIETHNAKIWVESSEGQGSSFYLQFAK